MINQARRSYNNKSLRKKVAFKKLKKFWPAVRQSFLNFIKKIAEIVKKLYASELAPAQA